MADKIITEVTHPNHQLVRALKKKGYTDIILEWNDALSRNRGWVMKTKQIPWQRLGAAVDYSLSLIEKLPSIEKTIP